MPLKNGDIANNTTFLHILTTSRKCNYNLTLSVAVLAMAYISQNIVILLLAYMVQG